MAVSGLPHHIRAAGDSTVKRIESVTFGDGNSVPGASTGTQAGRLCLSNHLPEIGYSVLE